MDVEKVKSMIDPELLKKDLCNQKAYDFVKGNAVKTAAPADEEKKPAKKAAAKKTAEKDAE